MKISNLFKKFKSQKGITGADVAIAVSIITIAVCAVTMIYVNLDLNQKMVTRTAGATRIATNIIEGIDSTDYDTLLSKIGAASDNTETFTSGSEKHYGTRIPRGYTAVVKLSKSGSTTDALDLVMKVEVTVKYKVGKNDREISVNTVKQMNFIANECNEPDFSQSIINGAKDLNNNSLAGKTIVKIKYNHAKGKYEELQDKNDPSWYCYSSKEWAQILAFDTKEQADNFFIDSSTGSIQGRTFDEIKEYLYVWIPNFDMSNEGTNSKYYFRNGANGILGEVDAKNGIVYVNKETNRGKASGGKYHIEYYTVNPSITFTGQTEFGNDYTGSWVKYWNSTIANRYQELNLNKLMESRYGPMNIY